MVKPPRTSAGKPPLAFKDQVTGILFYVESDGQHMAAINKDGKILWHRNVVADEGIKPYRAQTKPAIFSISEPLHASLTFMKEKGKRGPFVAISFTDRRFGLLDQRTGEYTLMGSD